MIKKEPFIGSFIFFFANFTESSSTFTVPKGVKKIDVFCVGGGGSVPFICVSYSDGEDAVFISGGGGGGGYTSTKLGADVNPGDVISVVVGAGGEELYSQGCNAGGTSSAGSICSANGGRSGNGQHKCVYGNQLLLQVGSDGGSGGAQGCSFYNAFSIEKGGTDGGDGSSITTSQFSVKGGKGQGTTTRYFGESSGTLYSTGGSCIPYNPGKFGSEMDSVKSDLPANT